MKLLVLFLSVAFVTADYWQEREELLKDEESEYLGHKIKLTPKEEAVNKKLMEAKKQELEEGFAHPESFSPAINFFLAKEKINKSLVYKFIQKMPKGGALHIHDTAIVSTDYILYNLTYRDHLLICQDEQNPENIQLKFADPAPQDKCWVPLKSLREKASSVEEFDAWLRSKITLETNNPYEEYPDINTVWNTFEKIFDVQTSVIKYQGAFGDYYYKALQEFREDNVNYVEVRGSLPSLYDLAGAKLNHLQVVTLLKEITDRFMTDYPDFLGVKYIYSRYRGVNDETMLEYLEKFKKAREFAPDFLVGFDLIGQEDLGMPLVNFIDRLLEAGPEVKFFFHAGETNWNGMSTDLNLVDALLLNSTRIGHAFALLKHPVVLEKVKQRDVAVELCPVSHQVLGLLKDLRNHPASALLAQDFPVVVSSDDPGIWGAKPLSHDFYEAFVGIASRQADLRLLKQLALNSLVYSSLQPEDKGKAIVKFQEKWDRFIDDVYTNGF